MKKSEQQFNIIKVFLVDDHKVVRDGIRRMTAIEPDIEIIGEAADGIEALKKLELISPDIVITNIKMPGIDGIEFTRQAKRKYPFCKFIMLTLYDQYLNQSLEAGASGYLLKDIKSDELIKAIKDVYQGQVGISTSLKKLRRKQL